MIFRDSKNMSSTHTVTIKVMFCLGQVDSCRHWLACMARDVNEEDDISNIYSVADADC